MKALPARPSLPLGGIEGLNRQVIQKLTLVVVTHDPLEATTLCTEALVLADGRVHENGTLENLLRAPRSELLKLFREARAAGSGRPRKGAAPT